jgi:hypothetical protein
MSLTVLDVCCSHTYRHSMTATLLDVALIPYPILDVALIPYPILDVALIPYPILDVALIPYPILDVAEVSDNGEYFNLRVASAWSWSSWSTDKTLPRRSLTGNPQPELQ